MSSYYYKLTELFIIFIFIPVSFVMQFPLCTKAVIAFFGFLYVIYILLKVERAGFKISKHINWKSFWKTTAIKFVLISLITTAFLYVTDKELLFSVVLNKPLLWLLILVFYSLFSVYPQEIIYRTFYFKRYSALFKNEKLFIFVNALVFSLAHLFFKSSLVIVLTFLGGLLFALTYLKTKSILLVSIEHAIYGCWLFTVGMGSMLGFPN